MASSEQNAILERPGAAEPVKASSEPQSLRRVLIVGGGIGGLAAARELRGRFRVTLVDAKEYFEFTSGIMRAYADPSHWDSLTFLYKEVLERNFGIGFIWGEVVAIDGDSKFAHVKTMFATEEDKVPFDYCIVAGGCNFNPHVASGESTWFPTVHQRYIHESEMRHLDERFLEGRRRRILEEHQALVQLNNRQENVLVVGAGPFGVEWACELQHHFPKLQVTVSDFLPRCLGPLPEDAAVYCEDYLRRRGIRTVYKVKFDRNRKEYWEKIGLPDGVAKLYIVSGVKQSNYFMPKNTLSDKGPSGGGWIMTNKTLQVVTENDELFGGGAIFAAGDCIFGCIGEAPDFEIPPMPKTGYTAEQQAIHCAQNVLALDHRTYGRSGCCGRTSLRSTWYPWGSGIFAISLGPRDGCFIVGNDNNKNSGRIWFSGEVAAAQKELIETTKVAQCRGDHAISSFIWYVIHHWPMHLVGNGPLCGAL